MINSTWTLILLLFNASFALCAYHFTAQNLVGNEEPHFVPVTVTGKRERDDSPEFIQEHVARRRKIVQNDNNLFPVNETPIPPEPIMIASKPQFGGRMAQSGVPNVHDIQILSRLGWTGPSISITINPKSNLAEAVFANGMNSAMVRTIIEEYNIIAVPYLSDSDYSIEMFKVDEIRRRHPNIHFNFIPRIEY